MILPTDLVCRIFFGGGEPGVFLYVCYGFGQSIKMMHPSFMTCYYRLQEIRIILKHLYPLILLVNLDCICSSVRCRGIHLEQTQRSCRMQNIDVYEILVDLPTCHSPIFLQDSLHNVNIFYHSQHIWSQIFWSVRFRSQFCRHMSFFDIIMPPKNRTLTKTFIFVM